MKEIIIFKYEITFTKKNGEFIYNDIYIELRSNELQKIDRDYNKILKFLCSNHFNNENILFRSNYSNGKSFGYSLNYRYLNSKFKIVNISRKSILKSLNNSCVVSISGAVINKDLRNLKNDFLNKFKINFEAFPKEVLDDNIISGYFSILSLIDYDNGSKRMSLNSLTDGRLHTNFTNLSKKHRNLITNNKGEQLIELDVGSCIPFLIIMSITYRIKLKPFIKTNPNLILYQEIFEDIYQYIINNYCKENLIKEISTIYDLIKSDSFYTDFYNKTNFCKKDILSIFFCENDSKINLENALKNLYPNLYFFLYQLKDNKTWSNKFGYPPYVDCNKILSHYLFHLESSIILFKVVEEIKKVNKKIEVISVHDCVMVAEQYKQEVKSIMENIFKQYFQLIPNIKIKYSK